MFTAVKHNLRNALVLAKSLMKLTEENYRGMIAVIDLMSANRYLLLGVGEDVEMQSPNVVLGDDALMVAASETTPGMVDFVQASYDYDMLLKGVVLDGEKCEFAIIKEYADATTKTFTPAQLPLKSSNFRLVVTIQPGGFLKRAVLLQEIVMD